MSKLTRRSFVKASATAAALGSAAAIAPSAVYASSHGGMGGGKVVVIGGGFGGTIAAKYIKKFNPNIDVTLIEVNETYATCPGSNWVIGGLRDLDSITFSYADLVKNYGIEVVHELVTHIDPNRRIVTTRNGTQIKYDRLIVSPGISFDWDAVEGMNEAASHEITHAWKAGPQTAQLRKQLEDMPNGGTFVIVPPPNPFRCPPGPAERISMVANYFKEHKPKSKIIALDVKPKFSKQGLFVQGWKDLYPADMIDYRHQTGVEEIDVATKTCVTDVDEIKADVLNFIPAQKAGHIAHAAGLTNASGWCPVNHVTWESTKHKNIHVIGDAAIQKPLPKSGYAANSEAKTCAAAVVALLAGHEPGMPSWVNTCYSLVGPGYGISVAMVYDLVDGKVAKVKGSGGLTPKDGNRAIEAVYAESWWTNVTNDMFT